MANKAPFFISGGNAKIRVNGVTLAYVTDFRYSVKITHGDARVLGIYEKDTSEPLAYDVSGGFTLIRYIEGMVKNAENNRQSIPNGASNLGNGVGSWTSAASSTLGRVANGQFSDGRANEALNPSKFHTGTWFDIEFYQKIGNSQLGIARMCDCRITSADTELNKRGVMVQTFTFTANKVDEDSFIANASGVGQTTA